MSSQHENRATIGAAATRLDTETLPGQAGTGLRRTIGEFEIIELLGEGAMAHVYLARQTVSRAARRAQDQQADRW